MSRECRRCGDGTHRLVRDIIGSNRTIGRPGIFVTALCGDWIADTANSERFLLFGQLDVGVLDDLRPFGDVGVDDSSEFVW